MMIPLIAISLGLAGSAAAVKLDQVTWGAVVLTFHGEKIPQLTSEGYSISPLGAKQALLAGQTLRDRYIVPPANESLVTDSAPIHGLSTSGIDNSQLSVLSTNDEFVAGSATAFMQGFYPPQSGWVITDETTLGNSTLMNFPLDGYQYPNIGTVGTLDYNYIWLAGDAGCTAYTLVELSEVEGAPYNSQLRTYEAFYQSLADTVFWNIDPSLLNYYQAYELYEYALYQYNHNTSIFQNMDPNDLAELFNLASQQQFLLNTPNSAGTISSIAGQTFASKVVQQFEELISSGGIFDKMSLLFGSFDPFLAFFALSNLSTGPAAGRFNFLPSHGSVMVFELFTPGNNTTFPDTSELWVRFMFRNGTDDDEKLIAYPLFGRGNSETSMLWSDFSAGMDNFALGSVEQWCSECENTNLFCSALLPDSTSTIPLQPASKRSVSSAVAGVIGAVVTLGVTGIVALLLVISGFRVGRRKDGSAEVGGLGVLRRSGSGGFKGAEKLASDTDLHLKGGAGATVVKHERVGSWELSESKHSSLNTAVESCRAVSTADYGRRHSEDGIGGVDPFGDPVKALDQV